MRETKFARIMALLLCLSMLVGSVAIIASAATDSNSNSANSLNEIRDLLNAESYGEYADKYIELDRGGASIVVDVTENYTTSGEREGDEFKVVENILGSEVLYTPQDGSVTFTVNVPKKAKYALEIEYLPLETSRATSIERVLYINSKVPFAEARYVTLPKYWVNEYKSDLYVVKKGEKPEDVLNAAVTAGYAEELEDGTLYIQYVYKQLNVQGDKWEEVAFLAKEDESDTLKYVRTEVVVPYKGVMTKALSDFYQEYGIRFFQNDIINNELRPTTKESVDQFLAYELKDSSGYYINVFEFVFDAGESTITLEGKNEPMYIKSITLKRAEDVKDYDTFAQENGYADAPRGQDVLILEAEQAYAMSNKTVYPVEDRSCAINSPADVTRTVLNTVGGEKWATAGQWVEYRFMVETSGMYDVVTRFRQNLLDGMFTCRALYLYSDDTLSQGQKGYYNGVPFAEAQTLMYNYNDAWQVSALTDGTKEGEGKKATLKTYPLYLEGGVEYTIRFEVTLGEMGEIVREVEECLSSINNDYLSIIQLTGATPDQYRDYYFSTIMPDVLKDMGKQGERLGDLALRLRTLAGTGSSNAATLEKVSKLLLDMAAHEDQVAKNLSKLKTYIGTLGTFLSDARTQPLQIDYIKIQPAGDKLPAATPNFFVTLIYEIKGFWQSFWRDYDTMGALKETDDEAVEVWLALARDQTQVIRSLINNEFTSSEEYENITVDLKLVAGGTLLPSILSGSGPDVNLGMVQGEVINYAIRSAVLDVKENEGYNKVDANNDGVYNDDDLWIKDNFNDSAMAVLHMADADGVDHLYGLPETQTFPMMYVRLDVLADLGLEVPTTWDELMACIPVLQANKMEIGLPTDYKIFLYQNNGELFADGGMRINLDSPVGLSSFEKMCNLFTMYSFPYAYDAANRFRTGEMPIIIGDYCGTYNQLKVFATEIEGMWKFVPLPGEMQADGTVNNVSISTVTATVMVKGCDAGDRAWKFMKWFTGPEAQAEYASEMVAVLGPSAKQATANRHALVNMPWTTEERAQVELQFNNLASIPNYPGAYILDRYSNFAFLNAYVDKMDPQTALKDQLDPVNKEIERKRKEFGLETLDGYATLARKRTDQIEMLINGNTKDDARKDDEFDGILHNPQLNGDYKVHSIEIRSILADVEKALKTKKIEDLDKARARIDALLLKMDSAGKIFDDDRQAIMGYDLTPDGETEEELKKEQEDYNNREKLRKCYSYEVYKNTTELVTQLKCCSDFLGDLSTCLQQNALN